MLQQCDDKCPDRERGYLARVSQKASLRREHLSWGLNDKWLGEDGGQVEERQMWTPTAGPVSYIREPTCGWSVNSHGERVDYKVRRLASLRSYRAGQWVWLLWCLQFLSINIFLPAAYFLLWSVFFSFSLTGILAHKGHFNPLCDATATLLAGFLALFQLRAAFKKNGGSLQQSMAQERGQVAV